MAQISKTHGRARDGAQALLPVFLLAAIGCGKSFVEADAIHKDEVAKLEALKAEAADKKGKVTAEMHAEAQSKFTAEVDRRKSLIAVWRKANPRPLGDRFPAVPVQLPRNLGELGPLGQIAELARRSAKETAALAMDIPPDEPFRMEIWTERWRGQPNAWARTTSAPMLQPHLEAHDEAKNRGFSLLFAPSPEWAAARPKPTFSLYPDYDLEQWGKRREEALANNSDQISQWDEQNPKPHFSHDEHCILKWENELQEAELKWEKSFRAFLATLGNLPPEKPDEKLLGDRLGAIEQQYQSVIDAQQQKVDEAAKVKEAVKK
ncbi:MAG TPA: hypothetical protein PK867_09815 [Pirellulales bacterium]|nr:hypothetical protein [Pirellulales bacterium]